MPIDKLIRVRQEFPRPRVEDVRGTVWHELSECGVRIAAGARVAIAVGSRGIAGLATLVNATVEWVRAQEGAPFIVPAMGSHGGATADGQRALLAGYGILEESVGAPVRSSMEVVPLPRGDLPCELWFDRLAGEADGTIIINRVKPHTDFHGPYESGLMKMMVLGLGKHRQAMAIHSRGVTGLRDLMPRAARQVISTANVLCGVAVVENAYDETQAVEALLPEDIPAREAALLRLARSAMPTLPIEDLDVLFIDAFGKDISGTGLDTNVIGRTMVPGQDEPESPRVAMIVLRDLTTASHGNACGMGLADIILRNAHDKVDFRATNENIFTSGFLARGKTPVVVENDLQAMEYALRGSGVINPGEARIMRIRNTLHVDEFLASEAIVRDLAGNPRIDVGGEVSPVFDDRGTFASGDH